MSGQLAANVMHFARVLRAAGLPLGSDRIQLALQALQLAGLDSRGDMHSTLAACLIDRVEHRELFDRAFELFWRDADPPGRLLQAVPPLQPGSGPGGPAPADRRLAEALLPDPPQRPREPSPPPSERPEPPERIDRSAPVLTASEGERLRKADFDTMSAAEWAAARRALQTLAPVIERLPTRRSRPSARGRADWRATLGGMARQGGDVWTMRWREPGTRPAPLVLLADISGSMSRYSRVLLHLAHALSRAEWRVESFVFGTRLTRTTRLLRQRDPDVAVAQVVRAVDDWSGGTRISACLHEFNQRWARRTLAGGASVLLVTDGLERGDTAALGFETERLHKSCRRLLWLNPLLRFDGFEPRAGGIRAMLPHVDRFMPAHNLDSLAALAQALCAPPQRLPPRAP